jgi:fatty acid desaturase
MKRSEELMTHQQYLAVIRPLLPPGVFRKNPRKLIWIGLHLLLVGGGYYLIREANAIWQWALLSLFIGHSIACLGLYAHDLSHKTILPGGKLLRFAEIIVWTVVAVPATMWRRVHNATHHLETNTVDDPDRWFLESERNPATVAYNKIFYPNLGGIRGNPLVWFHFPFYVLRNVWAALAGGPSKPVIVPAAPRYSGVQKAYLVTEIGFITVYQIGLLAFMNYDWIRFLWASPAVYLVTSAAVLTYIISNHSLNPLCEHTDPVAGSTTVTVPGVVDGLHSHFSHHTEHHLFPGMDSSHFPKVAEILRQQFPERYNKMPLTEVWRRLWKSKAFLD